MSDTFEDGIPPSSPGRDTGLQMNALAQIELLRIDLEAASNTANGITRKYYPDRLFDGVGVRSDDEEPFDRDRGGGTWNRVNSAIHAARTLCTSYLEAVQRRFGIRVPPLARLSATLRSDLILLVAVLVDLAVFVALLMFTIFGHPAFAQAAGATDLFSKDIKQIIALGVIAVICGGALYVLATSPHKDARKIAGDILKVMGGVFGGFIGKSAL